MDIFDNTVFNCSHIVDPGIYHMDNRFLFLVDPQKEAGKFSEELLQSSPHITKHRHVAIAKRFWKDADRYMIFGLNLGLQNRTGNKARLLYIWDAKSQPSTLEDGFYGKVTGNYNGHKFVMSSPVISTEVLFCRNHPKPFRDNKLGEDSQEYLGCQGLDYKQAEFAMEMFNITWGAIAPKTVVVADFDNKTWRWIGVMEDVMYGSADYSFVTQLITPANRIFQPTFCSVKPRLIEIVAAAPEMLSKFNALAYPFSHNLWPFVLGSVAFLSFLFPILSYLQRKIDTICKRPRERGISVWFCFSALIGENLRDESITYHRFPLRSD